MGAKLVLSGVQQRPLSMLERIHLGSGSDRITYADDFAAAQSFAADLLENGEPQATCAGMNRRNRMSPDDYVYDDDFGEWILASELAERNVATGRIEVRDAVGNLLDDGDQVMLIRE